MQEAQPPNTTPRQTGFGHSRRRVWIEIGGLLAAAASLIALLVWMAGALAQSGIAWIPLSVDESVGRAAWDSVAPPEKICKNPRVNAYVTEVAGALAPHFLSDFKFQFRVVDDDSVNAFALPGGFVTVNMGLLKKAESGDEVAAVLAHELAHVVQRHGMRRGLRQLGGTAAIALVFGGTDIEAPAAVIGGLASTAYDREQEAESDQLGREALMKAGVSPFGMARFFERLQADNAFTPPLLLSTHPDPGNRAAAASAAAQGFQPTRSLPTPVGLSCE
ncbi:MAG: hypothetical protein RJA70_923 [Pseudomonadota bacterium]|jgi:predicted Zn-dependent protease